MDVLKTWRKFEKLPAGRYLFSKVLGRTAPYTGSISPQILKIEPGLCIASMSDRKAVRNHLHSVHAVALMNLAEVSTGLALLSALPANARAIIKGLSIEYHKKARGKITAEASQSPIHSNEKAEITVQTVLKNEEGEVVCTAKANWVVGPKK